ncbi:MAG: TIGR00296 family protein [Thermoprotei archaeon]|nr:MAG: TIGR00296 family protein [Thermoprotei archaeon]RLF18877.1 MAG: TIGR00296 family protein [Thermoprotei archaeon]
MRLAEGEFLVRLARRAVEAYLMEGRQIKPPPDTPERLLEKRGVFVTINSFESLEGRVYKRLRGCIGYPEPIVPLVEATIDAAISSATSDPRFYPLTVKELSNVVFEVSVLTPLELIKVSRPSDLPKKIKVGRDGLVVERGIFKGLLLPQVAVEWGWDEETFLSEACMKAGLFPDAWLIEGTKVYKFEAEIFEELEPSGRVIRKELMASR